MESFSYACLIAWANICKWGWWATRKAKALWLKAPDRCRVYTFIIGGILLFTVSMAVFADHKVPTLDGSVEYFHLQSPTNPIACDPSADSDGLHPCWPYVMTETGPVFGEHGWCFAETDPFTEGARWGCAGSHDEALDMKSKTLDVTPI